MARNVTIQIRAETDAAEENLQSVEAEISDVGESAKEAGTETDQATDRMGEGAQEAAADIDRSAERIEEEMVDVAQSADRAASSTSQVGTASSSASALIFDLSDAAQDMTHNLSAGANNAGFLFEQFGRVRQESGGLLPALNSIGGALAGPAGIAFAVTTVMQHSDDLIAFFTESGEAADQAAERYKEAADSILSIEAPGETENIELGLDAARETVSEVEQDLQGVRQEVQALDAIKGALPEALEADVPLDRVGTIVQELQDVNLTIDELTQARQSEDESVVHLVQERLSAAQEEKRQLEAGRSVLEERIGETEAELQLRRRIEERTEGITSATEEGTDAVEQKNQALNGLTVSAKQAAENMETVDRFFEGREQQQSLFQPIEMPEVPSLGEAMLQNIGPTQNRLDAVGRLLQDIQGRAETIELSSFLSDATKAERKVKLAGSALQELQSRGIPLTEEAFNRVVQSLDLSTREAKELRRIVGGVSTEANRAAGEFSELEKAQQRLVQGEGGASQFLSQIDQAGKRLQQFGLGGKLEATRLKIQLVTQALQEMRRKGVDPTAQRVQNLKNELRSLRQQAAQTRIAQRAGLQAAQAGFRNLGQVIAGAKSEMEAFQDVASQVLQAVGSALLQAAIAGPLGAPFAIAGGAMIAGGSAIQALESGGEADAPVQLVGEQGPELVSLPEGSRVADHESSKEIVRMVERASEGRDPQQNEPIVTPTVSAAVGRMARGGAMHASDSGEADVTGRIDRLVQSVLSGPDGSIESGSTTSNGKLVVASRPDSTPFHS